jgi:hypothetical protein
MHALVFVSFDPSTRLPGLKEWGGECSRRDSGYDSGHGEEEHIMGLDHWTVGPAGEDAMRHDEVGKGKGKQQVAASPLPDTDDNESVASPLPQSDCFPGWTPEASFDWPVQVTGADNGTKGKGKQELSASPLPDMNDNESVTSPPPHSDYFPGGTPGGDNVAKGKGKAAADAAASCGGGDNGAGDLNATRRDGDAAADAADADADALPSQSSAPADNGASSGGSGSVSSSQQPQPREAPLAATTTPTKQQPRCEWASTGIAMWREINSGFNSLPDFTSPRFQTP